MMPVEAFCVILVCNTGTCVFSDLSVWMTNFWETTYSNNVDAEHNLTKNVFKFIFISADVALNVNQMVVL